MSGEREERGRARYEDDHDGGYDNDRRGDNGDKQDETIECRDCQSEFVFTVAEQDFYAEKGFENKPVRCKACKNAKKSRMEGGGSRGGSYGGERGGYNDRGGGGGGYGDRDRDRGDSYRGGGGGGGGGAGVCYAFQKGECQRGSSCRFSHEGGSGGGGGGGRGGYSERSGGDRSGGGGGGRGVCYSFQKGQCDRGSSCRFSHE